MQGLAEIWLITSWDISYGVCWPLVTLDLDEQMMEGTISVFC